MTDEIVAYSRADHPAPHRGRVSFASVLYALFAAPIAWAGALIVNYALVGHACYPADQPLGHPTPGLAGVWGIVLACHLIALAVIASGALVAYRNWRVTGPPPGHSHHMIERGEGRNRYLGIVGMGFDAMFFLIVAAETVSLGLVPLCWF